MYSVCQVKIFFIIRQTIFTDMRDATWACRMKGMRAQTYNLQ
jgi:hypothetical protein